MPCNSSLLESLRLSLTTKSSAGTSSITEDSSFTMEKAVTSAESALLCTIKENI